MNAMETFSDYEPPSAEHYVTLQESMMKGLRELYLAELLCDVTLVTDVKRFKCHRIVLASVSPYFQAMFTSTLQESKSGEVFLLDISPNTIESVLQFIYSGEITLGLDSAQELFVVSCRLQIPSLQDQCSSYLIKALNCENCIWMYKMAHGHNNKSLLEATLRYISCHITSVSEAEDFLHLHLTDLTKILSADSLMVSSEHFVYQMACRWWELNRSHHACFPEELLRVIRLPLMSSQELSEVREYIDWEGHMKHTQGLELRQGMFEERIVCMDLRAREDLQLNDNDFQLDSYDPVSGVWEKIPSLKSLMCPGCLTVGHCLYVTGGIHQDDSFSSTLHVYDSVRNDWKQLPSMGESRAMHGFLPHNRKLYAVGGSNVKGIIDSVEYYSIDENYWAKLSNLPLPLCRFAFSQLNDKHYVIGGETNGRDCVEEHQGFLIYNTITDAWSLFSLNVVCSSAGAVASDNKIFVIGGWTNSEKSTSCTIATSRCFCMDHLGRLCSTCPVPSLPVGLASSGVVRWKQRIYVLGGENQRKFSNRIYYWTPGASEWTLCNEKLPVPYQGVSDFGCVTLKVPRKCFHSLIPGRKRMGGQLASS